ncbi:MAG: hypothetical protein RR795_01305 [Cetobacterium sp.]|uniref:hypothetical protein n=1 Tax=Cetobacterium sp. TaxID=2071632 RepID=UPI002FCB6979
MYFTMVRIFEIDRKIFEKKLSKLSKFRIIGFPTIKVSNSNKKFLYKACVCISKLELKELGI